MDAFRLSARLVPRSDSQTAKDAISRKPVSFSVDDKFVGGATSEVNGDVSTYIPVNWSRQLNLQAGIHPIKVTTTHQGHVITRYGKLTVQKENQNIHFLGYWPAPQWKNIAGHGIYSSGQIVTYRALLLHPGGDPITRANVNCVSIYPVKILRTVQTNNQGGFECPITLTPDLFSKEYYCKIYWTIDFAASFENQNYNKVEERFKYLACHPGMHFQKNCPEYSLDLGKLCFECCR